MFEKDLKDNILLKKSKVPFFVPNISADDRKAVIDALKSPLLTDGPKLREFESAFARFTGAKYAIGVSNATSALQLTLKSLGIKKGEEVIVPDITFVATVNAVLLCNATPVLVDVEKEDFNISIESVKNSITKKTKLILPVHMAGKVCKINEIIKIAKHNDLLVLEDCAHAIGTRTEGKHVGMFGNAGCFSFYPTKNITTIEGGMIITNSEKIAKYVTSARNHGLSRSLMNRFSHGKPWDYDVVEPGYNYRLDEVRSALGLSQLKRLKELNLLRRNACEYYKKKLESVKGVITPQISQKDDNVYHLYITRITKEYNLSRDELFTIFAKEGITTSLHYKPLHKFTAYKNTAKIYDELKNSNELYNEIISLPLYPKISRNQQDLVIECIKNNQ